MRHEIKDRFEAGENPCDRCRWLDEVTETEFPCSHCTHSNTQNKAWILFCRS